MVGRVAVAAPAALPDGDGDADADAQVRLLRRVCTGSPAGPVRALAEVGRGRGDEAFGVGARRGPLGTGCHLQLKPGCLQHRGGSSHRTVPVASGAAKGRRGVKSLILFF